MRLGEVSALDGFKKPFMDSKLEKCVTVCSRGAYRV